ncbi:hypothetical protein ACLOJK_019764 [Asimina triloba]
MKGVCSWIMMNEKAMEAYTGVIPYIYVAVVGFCRRRGYSRLSLIPFSSGGNRRFRVAGLAVLFSGRRGRRMQ